MGFPFKTEQIEAQTLPVHKQSLLYADTPVFTGKR